MKVLYTLAFVLLSFAASAQTLDAAMIAAYYLDDCCEETTGQSTMPAATVAAEPTIEKPGDAMLSAEGSLRLPTTPRMCRSGRLRPERKPRLLHRRPETTTN